MNFSDLEERDLYEALAANHKAIANSRRYQAALVARRALPANAEATAQLIASANALVGKIEEENAALNAELNRRHNK